MKYRRGGRNTSTSKIPYPVTSQSFDTRVNSRKGSNWIVCGFTVFIFTLTTHIVRSIFVLIDENAFRHVTTARSVDKRPSSTFKTTNDGPTSSKGIISSLGPISSHGAFQPNSTDHCDLFDHGDISSFPNLTSVFNCNSPSGRCKWFYPAKFFNRYCGVGKKYGDVIEYMESQRIKRVLWKGGPPIVLPWVSLHPGIKPNGKPPGRTIPLLTHNLSMVHVHKTGGTSLVTAFSSLSSSRKVEGKRMMTYQPAVIRRPQPKKIRSNLRPALKEKMDTIYNMVSSTKADFNSSDPKYRIESSAFLNGAVKYRRYWGEREHTLFAVVRDPAERFISAIGQATGAYGSTNNGVATWLREECVKSTGRETLRCFVNVMKKNSTWIEVHFTPMSYEISFATMYKDIPVAVFPFAEVPTLMYELNQRPGAKKKDGKKKGFRKSEVLTHLSVQDYDEGTLRDLCKVYEVDALFLRYIGYATLCDPYISFDETTT